MNKTYDWLDKALTLSGMNLSGIRKDVAAMRDETDLKLCGGKSRRYISYAVSSRLIKNSALKAAGVGGFTSIPGSIPGIGALGTALFGVAVDFFFLMRIQIELCYAVSAAYEVDMDEDELKAITLAILGFSASAEVFKTVTTGMIRHAVDELATRYVATGLPKAVSEVAERLAPKLLGRSYKFLPFVSIPLAASINMVSTMTVGNHARKYFSVWAEDPDIDAGIADDVDPGIDTAADKSGRDAAAPARNNSDDEGDK
jgi:hypothetical protein